ncbi:MAG TPA: bifunctional UDP-3-O-[3-hydroxymyristoyl] N-acetylglucosamine deacetylase/3-hydroxyacyl-ACP dehydratase [Bacteroidetes bacterium]|nr:bifunctional UDP-3-O-[3-hydroxymyristoyl] N-acetylglucosamine deacetylase/3-hydroxyacyl-ACP dehydratase [Bacteroidota bacterium]
MPEKQKTLAKSFSLNGKGLHTGLDVEITFHPAPPDHGILFKRTDLKNSPMVHALAEYVTDTSRGTTIEENEVKVATIEHVMAAMYGMGIDNVLIEINGPEAPILDGSSHMYVQSIEKAGITDQDAPKNHYVVKEKIVYSNEEQGVDLIVYPDDHLSINVLIDYNSKILGNQYAVLNQLSEFPREVSMCRTFVFFHELEMLAKHNLIKGGDLDNAIIILERSVSQEELDRVADLFNKPHIKVKPEGVLNNIDLHFSNEPARHKLLDIIGDLALVGQPIKGKIVATRPGHYANTQLARRIRQEIKKEKSKLQIPKYDPNTPPVFDINQIRQILPHRPPFLLVDKIIQMDENSVVGLKNVTMNEGYFVGHFPVEPIMPGVLQVEAMAQVGGMLVLNSVPDPWNYSTYFLKIDKVKFKDKVIPGDTILFKLELTEPIRRGIVQMYGQAFVGDRLVMEGELTAQILKDKNNEPPVE